MMYWPKQHKPFLLLFKQQIITARSTSRKKIKILSAKHITDEELKKYGFESLKEYHAFAYTDYCIKKFMEAAKRSPYFNNTIFVFTGDHGVEGNARHLSKSLDRTALK